MQFLASAPGGFQSTLPRGERPKPVYGTIKIREFQSTLPRGERRPNKRVNGSGTCFNPRSRAGSDLLFCHLSGDNISFNPRSRAGSDAGMNCSLPWYSRFQSTLPRGERRDDPRLHSLAVGQVSIHAPARGATRPNKRVNGSSACFNPRSRAGSDAAYPSLRV